MSARKTITIDGKLHRQLKQRSFDSEAKLTEQTDAVVEFGLRMNPKTVAEINRILQANRDALKKAPKLRKP